MKSKFVMCNAAAGAIIVCGAAFAKEYSGNIYWTGEKNLPTFDQKTAYSAEENGSLVKITQDDSVDWKNATVILDASKTDNGVNAMLGPRERFEVKNLVIENTWNTAQNKDKYFWFAESNTGAPIIVSDTFAIKGATSGRVNGTYGIRTGSLLLENLGSEHVRIALGGDAAFRNTSGLAYLKVESGMEIKGNIALITDSKNAIGSKNAQSAANPSIEIGGKVLMVPVGTYPAPSWETQWLKAPLENGVAQQFIKLGGLEGNGNLAISKTGVAEKSQATYIFTNPKKSVADFNGKIIYYGARWQDADINMVMDGEGVQIVRVQGKASSAWHGGIAVNSGVFGLSLPQGNNFKIDVALNGGRFGAVGAEKGKSGFTVVNSLKWNGGAIYSAETDGMVSGIFVEEPIELSADKNATFIFAVDSPSKLEGKWVGAMLSWGSWNDEANRAAFEKAAAEKRIRLFVNGKEYTIERIKLNDCEIDIMAGKAK